MGFSIEYFGPGIVGTVFDGNIDMPERFQALDALDRAIEASKPQGILIDLTKAALGPYAATDALKLADRISRRERPLRKVAYVVRPYQNDMVASVMSGLHGQNTFRRFEDRESALAWLKQAIGV